LEFEIENLREILTQVVRCPGLQRLPVLHHRFARVRTERAREPFGVRLEAGDDGHRHPAFHEVAIQPEDHACLFLGFVMRGMRGMTLLPEKFQRS